MMCGIYVCVVFLCYQAGTVTGADVSLGCPGHFFDQTDYSIDCIVDKGAIDDVTCTVNPTLLGFAFKGPTEQTSSIKCSATYPCTSPAPVTATGKCGCTKQEGDIFTYTFLFKANKTTDEGGTFTCQICANPDPPLSRISSDSCNTIEILIHGDPTPPTVLTVLAYVVLIIPISFVVYLCIQKELPQKGFCGNKLVAIGGFVLAAVVVLVFMVVATVFSCQNYPYDEKIETLCEVDIALTVIAVIAVGIMIAPVVIFTKNPGK